MKTLLSMNSYGNGPHLRTCFIGFTYLLAGLAVACLMFGAVIPLAAGILFATALALCFTLEIFRKIPIIPPNRFSIWVPGLIILPLIYLVWKPPVLDLTVWFLVFVLLTRFVFKSELNDYLYGYLISIVCLLIGAIFIQDIVFGLLFFAFYMVLSWCLMFYNMMVERVGTRCPPAGFRRAGENEPAGVSIFVVSSTMVLASFMLTAAIFFSFPRLGLGFLELDSGRGSVSGFSNRVSLGEVGAIKQNDNVVMRVEFRKNGQMFRPASKVLWRGVALDFYDGKAWTSTMPPAWRVRNRDQYGVNLLKVPAPRELVVQDIYMESFDSPYIFTYGIPIQIEGTFDRLQMDQGYSMQTLDNRNGPRRFTLITDIGPYQALYTDPSPMPMRRFFPSRFLQLPDISPRTTRLARQLAKPEDAPAGKAEAILKFLQTGYGYSLDMKRKTDQSALDEFLFERKEGHCEYFASAMAVLLRLNGIPSRIVNGFSTAEWNDMGNYMVVRQAHAHSWVEAYIPGVGWQVYDPTPPDPTAVSQSRSALSRRLDLLRLYWQRYVVRYSSKDQKNLVQYFQRETRNFKTRLKHWKLPSAEEIWKTLQQNPWVLLVLAAGVLAWRFGFKKFGWPGQTRGDRPPLSVQLYHQMLKRLETHGIVKPKNATHLEFLNSLEELPPQQREAVESITRFYEQSRFGKSIPSPDELKQIKTLVGQL